MRLRDIANLADLARRSLGATGGLGTGGLIRGEHHVVHPRPVPHPVSRPQQPKPEQPPLRRHPAPSKPPSGIPLPNTPSHQALGELYDLVGQVQMGIRPPHTAATDLNRILALTRRISPSVLTPQQRTAFDAAKSLIETWQSQPTIPSSPPTQGAIETVDDVEILGRADIMQWPKKYRDEATEERMFLTPGSSNVYSFTWVEDEEAWQRARKRHSPSDPSRVGVMIVTFKDWKPGDKVRTNTAGATYAYSNVSYLKYKSFKDATTPDSAGYAVWDYLRIRGSISGHQHPYRLLSVAGPYIPRKVVANLSLGGIKTGQAGYATRMLPGAAEEQVAWRRSTLDPMTVQFNNQIRRPGQPNRGTPNNGRR